MGKKKKNDEQDSIPAFAGFIFGDQKGKSMNK